MNDYVYLIPTKGLLTVIVEADNEEEAKRKMLDGYWAYDDEVDNEILYDEAELNEVVAR